MKKKFQAIKADTTGFKGIVHDGKRFLFDKNDTFVMNDAGLAREVEAIHGKKGTQKLAIVPYNDFETRELGHIYIFGATSGYARAWAAFEKRRRKRGKK